MKSANDWRVVCALTIFTMSVAGAIAATDIPYAEDFNSGWAEDADPWSDSNTGIVTDDASAALDGAGGLIVSNDTVVLDITDATYSEAWIQVYANPVAGDSDPSPAGVSGSFYVTTGGVLRAYTGSWVTVASGLPTGTYLGFTVHADYTSDTWDLYYTSGGYTSSMAKANSAPLPFTAPASVLETVSIESGERAYVDAIAVSPAYNNIGDLSDSPANVIAIELATTAQVDFELQIYSDIYTNETPDQDLVSSAVGNDLLSGMVDGDELVVLTTTNANADQYEVNAGAWFRDTDTLDAQQPTAKEILISTRLQLDLDNARSTTWAFLGYNTALAVQSKATGAATGYQETFVLNGTGNNGGFTACEWAEAESNPNNLGFTNAHLDTGDYLYVQVGDTGAWRRYIWNAGASEFRLSGVTATDPVPAGARCWVQRRTSATPANFTVTH
ncbi:MAG: hypothetical protein O3A51_03640 [Verrucomicrobia bacterium]|nr:hypothetical protein [Verrucomicrobiota bacterium]